jgi:hypothetical protein
MIDSTTMKSAINYKRKFPFKYGNLKVSIFNIASSLLRSTASKGFYSGKTKNMRIKNMMFQTTIVADNDLINCASPFSLDDKEYT